jgi:hypothetical protein
MNKTDITVIITIWKRDYLSEQLDSLLNQTVRPESIIIIQNEHHRNAQDIVDKYKILFPKIFLVVSDYNFKYFFRFSLAILVKSTYTFLIDDDVIPGNKWLETCIEKCEKYGSVISCSGRIIPKLDFRLEDWEKFDTQDLPKYFIGNYNINPEITYNYCNEDTIVDYGCNSYFLKTEWIKYFWEIWPYSFESGEDIHLSASLKIVAGIETYVPKQESDEMSGNLKKKYGSDMVASWTKPNFVSIREAIFIHLINTKYWKPLSW